MWSFWWGCTNGGVPPVLKKWKLAPEVEAGATDSLTPQTAIIFFIFINLQFKYVIAFVLIWFFHNWLG